MECRLTMSFAETWMKAALKLANPSATERKACRTVLHRHALKALEPIVRQLSH